METRKRSPFDFVFQQKLGHGSYSTVYRAIDKHSPRNIYAIKVCSKAYIIKENKVKYVTIEKNTLNLLAKGNHPGIVKLYYTFHDEENLYFVLDCAPGGELLALLHRMTRFPETWSKHFTAQLIDILEYMHEHGVVHRDLKPENVLLSKEGRLMVTDFGAAATDVPVNQNSSIDQNDENSGKASSFVGTAEYVSPELLLYNKCDYRSDIWALGCMLYQFSEGQPPFRGANEMKTFEKIVSLDYPWNNLNTQLGKATMQDNSSASAQYIYLVQRILTLDPKDRLNLQAIKADPWFSDVIWTNKTKLWRGIWQITQSPTTSEPIPNYPTNTDTSNSTLLSDRKLHVIDTPVRNIMITKQKKKKPTKTNTTNSIVEWRKKLGISSSSGTTSSAPPIPGLSSGGVPLTSIPDVAPNGGLRPFIPKQVTKTLGQINIENKAINESGVRSKPLNDGRSIQIANEDLNIPLQTNNLPLDSLPNGTNSHLAQIVPSRKVKPTIPDGMESPSIKQSKALYSSPKKKTFGKTFLESDKDRIQQIWKSVDKNRKSIMKQDLVYIHEIPYDSNGPTMTSNSYNDLNNELITNLVSSYESALKTKDHVLRILTVHKDGTLSYSNIQAEYDQKIMVNIGDSDLSMYDYEFDETSRSGFLILEKYQTKIWLITLPTYSKLTALATETINENVVNVYEDWISCFFRTRRLNEEHELVTNMKKTTLEESTTNNSPTPQLDLGEKVELPSNTLKDSNSKTPLVGEHLSKLGLKKNLVAVSPTTNLPNVPAKYTIKYPNEKIQKANAKSNGLANTRTTTGQTLKLQSLREQATKPANSVVIQTAKPDNTSSKSTKIRIPSQQSSNKTKTFTRSIRPNSSKERNLPTSELKPIGMIKNEQPSKRNSLADQPQKLRTPVDQIPKSRTFTEQSQSPLPSPSDTVVKKKNIEIMRPTRTGDLRVNTNSSNKLINRKQNIASPTSPGVGSSESPKLSSPGNLLISSSRYEILQTLNKEKRNLEASVAGAGASAAFRSSQQASRNADRY